MRRSILLSVWGLLVCSAACLSQAVEIPVFGKMEGPFVGGVSSGWENNSYGANKVVCSAEWQDVHSGRAAQRIECSSYTNGGIQIRHQGVAVEKNKPYTLRVWLKGDVTSLVKITLRKQGAPYTAYLSRPALVDNTWRLYEVSDTARESDSFCGIYISFASAGTLLVDDIALFSGIVSEAGVGSVTAVKGNRIFNSNFEEGYDGWAPAWIGLDSVDFLSGRHSALVTPAGIESRPFHLEPNNKVSISLYMKPKSGPAAADVSLIEWAGDGTDGITNHVVFSEHVTLSENWTRYVAKGINKEFLWSDYVLKVVPSSSVNVDKVQVEEGETTDYRPKRDNEIGLEVKEKWCYEGDPVHVTARLSPALATQAVSVEYTVEDLWSRSAAHTVHSVSHSSIDDAVFTGLAPGSYRIKVKGNGTDAGGEGVFAVFRKSKQNNGSSSSFGIHFKPLFPQFDSTVATAEASGVGWIRLHDFGNYCEWFVEEPNKGEYRWFDAQIDSLAAHGYSIMATLGLTPPWAGKSDPNRRDYGGRTNEIPADDNVWDEYVYKTVSHYKDKIKRWEIWNEPASKEYFLGTPQDYVHILSVAYKAAKRADPGCTVVGGCFLPTADDWTKDVLAGGALAYMDALAFHVYWTTPFTAAASGAPPPITAMVDRYEELMSQNGAVKPMYMTEGGVRALPLYSWLPESGPSPSGFESACALVKGVAQLLSGGVKNICYYFAGFPSGGRPFFSMLTRASYMMMDNEGRPKATMTAYSTAEQFLNGAVPISVVVKNGLTEHLFKTAEGSLAVVWSESARSIHCSDVEVYDVMGNPTSRTALLPGEPVYVRSLKLQPQEIPNHIQ